MNDKYVTFILILTLWFVPHNVAVAENWQKGFDRVVLKNRSHSYLLDVSYPQFIGIGSPDQLKRLNRAVKKYAYRLFAKYGTRLVELGPSALVEWHLVDGLGTEIELSFDVARADADFVSVSFTRYIYCEGAAHGIVEVYGFNYDVRNGSMLTLEDLFISKEGITEVIGYTDGDLKRQFKEFWNTGDTGRNMLDQFVLGERAITILFSAYQVASTLLN